MIYKMFSLLMIITFLSFIGSCSYGIVSGQDNYMGLGAFLFFVTMLISGMIFERGDE